MLLSDRVAVITGGARGIGRAITLKFAEQGCKTVIADIRPDEAEETLKQVSAKNSEGIFVRCDVSNSAQVRDMVGRVIEKYGKIDILVNDAAISPPERSFVDITEEEWDRTLAVNLKSVFLCCKYIVPHMKEKKYGKVINIASVGAVSPSRVIADYCAAKSGVVMLSQCLAADVAEHNICVNSVLPGITRTDLHDAVRPEGMPKDEYFSRLGKIIPLGRVGETEDIAEAVLFLASDLSRYITGDRIMVSGGFNGQVNLD
jgi:NAD(P)-dependent dehydrogenase (short-subunit alcohol dehydrogenase family)